MIRTKSPVVNPYTGINTFDTSQTGRDEFFSGATKAVVDQTVNELPVVSLAQMAEEGDWMGRDNTQHLDAEALNNKKETDFYAQYMDLPEEGMSEREYQTLYKHTRERKMRESTLSRAPQTFGRQAQHFFIALGINMIDPLNIAAGYTPFAIAKAVGVIGTTALKNSSLLIKQKRSLEVYNRNLKLRHRNFDKMGKGDKLKSRAKTGVVEGTVGAALVEPLIYTAANMRGEEYTYEDVLTNIAFGTALGTGMHVGFGKVGDILDAEGIRMREGDRIMRAQMAEDYLQGRRELHKGLEDFNLAEWLAAGEARKLEMMNSSVSKQLAKLKAGDKKALMQAQISLFTSDREVNVGPLVEMMNTENISRWSLDDVDAMRETIVEDFIIEAEQTAQAATEGGSPRNFRARIDRAKGELVRLEKERDALMKTEGPSGPRKKLHQRVEAKQLEIDNLTKTKKDSSAYSKNMRERAEAARRGELDPSLQRKVDAELERQLDIIRATDEGDLPQMRAGDIPTLSQTSAHVRHALANKQSLAALHDATTNPTKARSHRPNAHEDINSRGTPKTDEAETADIIQQEADAEEMAIASAEAMGLEYNPKADLEDSLAAIEDDAEAYEIMATCMVKS